jgi:hypothetical protein
MILDFSFVNNTSEESVFMNSFLHENSTNQKQLNTSSVKGGGGRNGRGMKSALAHRHNENKAIELQFSADNYIIQLTRNTGFFLSRYMY